MQAKWGTKKTFLAVQQGQVAEASRIDEHAGGFGSHVHAAFVSLLCYGGCVSSRSCGETGTGAQQTQKSGALAFGHWPGPDVLITKDQSHCCLIMAAANQSEPQK